LLEKSCLPHYEFEWQSNVNMPVIFCSVLFIIVHLTDVHFGFSCHSIKGAVIWNPVTSYHGTTFASDFVWWSGELSIHEYNIGGVERYPPFASNMNGNCCFDVRVKLQIIIYLKKSVNWHVDRLCSVMGCGLDSRS
jgi:hypothetical protein